MAHAEAYKDPGTPQEQSRRTFMAQATIALGGVIGISLVIPLVTSLVPASDASNEAWSALTPDEVDMLKKATATTPVKVTFNVHETNGYYGASDIEQFVWAVRASDAEMEKARPDLFNGSAKLPYPVVNMGFTVFSPLCPHLGCRYSYNEAQKKFLCSAYTRPARRCGDSIRCRCAIIKVKCRCRGFCTKPIHLPTSSSRSDRRTVAAC